MDTATKLQGDISIIRGTSISLIVEPAACFWVSVISRASTMSPSIHYWIDGSFHVAHCNHQKKVRDCVSRARGSHFCFENQSLTSSSRFIYAEVTSTLPLRVPLCLIALKRDIYPKEWNEFSWGTRIGRSEVTMRENCAGLHGTGSEAASRGDWSIYRLTHIPLHHGTRHWSRNGADEVYSANIRKLSRYLGKRTGGGFP